MIMHGSGGSGSGGGGALTLTSAVDRALVYFRSPKGGGGRKQESPRFAK